MVYRADAEDGERVALCDWQSGCSFNDLTAEEGVDYFYFVVASATAAGDRAGEASAAVTGKRKVSVRFAALSIVGADAVQSGESSRFLAVANFSDGSSAEIAAAWSVAGEGVAITDDGTLTTEPFADIAERTAFLTATADIGGARVARKQVRVTPAERRAEVIALALSNLNP